MGFIARSWSGQEKLWKVFWLYGFLGCFVIGILFGIIGFLLLRAGLDGPAASILGLILMLVYYVWLMVSEWRCAWNVKVKFWGYLVRVLVVLSVIGTLIQGGQAVMHRSSSQTVVASDISAPSAEVETPAPASTATPNATAGLTPIAGAVPVAQTPAPTVPVATAPATVASAPLPTSGVEASATCQARMTEYATQHHVDPQGFIAQNQPYLQKCIQILTNNPGAK